MHQRAMKAEMEMKKKEKAKVQEETKRSAYETARTDREEKAAGINSSEQSLLQKRLDRLEELRKQEQEAWKQKNIKVAPPDPL